MKNILCLTVCALSLLAFASTAQSGVAQATGSFQFDLAGAAGTVNFDSHIYADGTADGQMSFTATVDTGDPGTGDTVASNIALTVQFDCVVVNGNRAAMSGTIVDESSPFNGQHAILAVESASNNDGFTWGVYKQKVVNTNAKDYEFCDRGYTPPNDCGELNICPVPGTACVAVEGPPPPDDSGATMIYTASDYELCPYPPPSDTENFLPAGDPHDYVCFFGGPTLNNPNDPNATSAGIPISATQTLTNADSFPVFSYPMTPVPHGGGNKVTVKNNS